MQIDPAIEMLKEMIAKKQQMVRRWTEMMTNANADLDAYRKLLAFVEQIKPAEQGTRRDARDILRELKEHREPSKQS